jgi:VanZ family protein
MSGELHKEKNPPTRSYSSIVLAIWVLSIGIVCYLSLTPEVEFPVSFKWDDLAYHSLAYLWLSVLPFLGFQGVRIAFTSAFLMIPLGIVLEFTQHFVPGRFLSVEDMIANTSGTLLGIFCGYYLRTKLSVRFREPQT